MSQSVMNKKDRSVQFWKFFVMFLLSTTLIVWCIFFNYQLPNKEMAVLRSDVYRYRIQEGVQNKFVSTMDMTKRLIDSLNTPGASIDYLNQQIAEKIRELDNLQYKDSTFYSSLNKSAVNTMFELQAATNKVVKYGKAPEDLELLKAKFEVTQRDLEQAKKDNDNLRVLLNRNQD